MTIKDTADWNTIPLPQMLAQELRKRGNKSVKSIFYNADRKDLSVFAVSHTPEKPKSFNYALVFDPKAEGHIPVSIEKMADDIAALCDKLNSDKNIYSAGSTKPPNFARRNLVGTWIKKTISNLFRRKK